MTVEELEIASQAMFPKSRLSIEIYRNRSWVGSCVFVGGQIAELYAVQLGVSGPETDEILAAITRAIHKNETFVDWHGQRFTWRFKTPIVGRS